MSRFSQFRFPETLSFVLWFFCWCKCSFFKIILAFDVFTIQLLAIFGCLFWTIRLYKFSLFVILVLCCSFCRLQSQLFLLLRLHLWCTQLLFLFGCILSKQPKLPLKVLCSIHCFVYFLNSLVMQRLSWVSQQTLRNSVNFS